MDLPITLVFACTKCSTGVLIEDNIRNRPEGKSYKCEQCKSSLVFKMAARGASKECSTSSSGS